MTFLWGKPEEKGSNKRANMSIAQSSEVSGAQVLGECRMSWVGSALGQVEFKTSSKPSKMRFESKKNFNT